MGFQYDMTRAEAFDGLSLWSLHCRRVSGMYRVCHSSGGAPGFLCHAQGFPFSVASWPSGRHQQWPGAACAHDLPAAMPNYVQQPPFADAIDVRN